MELTEVLQALTDGGIFFTIVPFVGAGGGYNVTIIQHPFPRDEKFSHAFCSTTADIAPTIHRLAMDVYPDSDYAKRQTT